MAVVSVVSGTVAVLLTYMLGASIVTPNSWGIWIVAAVTFCIAGALCGVLHPKASWLLPMGVLVGIGAGVLIEAIFQEFVNTKSRNLWPIDIAMWWLVGIVPIYLGFALGRFMRR
jgi:phosphatidylglycerophosphate synthase